MEVPRGSAVLDLGCGNGAATAHFEQLGWRMSGVDNSESGIALASEAYPACRVRCCDAQGEPPFAGSRVSAIIAIEVIEHVFALVLIIANCCNSLAPDSRLIINPPYHVW